MDSINESTNILVKNITDSFLENLQRQVTKLVSENVSAQMLRLDISNLAREHISNLLDKNKGTFNFPNRSVKGSSIDPNGLYIRADQIAGGTYLKFESTGIQDSATSTQVTIMDNATVFENQLVANTLHIAGETKLEGDVIITGSINEDCKLFTDVVNRSISAIKGEMQSGMLATFRDQTVEKLRSEGLDASTITVRGQKLVVDGKLAPNVLFTNIQKVGALRELQVVGETLLDETVYVSNHRFGINTMEPEKVFDLWDQEIEIQIGKYGKDIGIVGTPKPQHLIFSSNKNNNLVLNPDGSVTVEKLYIGTVPHTCSATAPTGDVSKGHIVWNSDPKLDSPIGWVSLGGARWASFGQITA